jgi:hypothetical protein
VPCPLRRRSICPNRVLRLRVPAELPLILWQK